MGYSARWPCWRNKQLKKYLNENDFFSPKDNRFIVLYPSHMAAAHMLYTVLQFRPDYLLLFGKMSPDSNTRLVRGDEIDPTLV